MLIAGRVAEPAGSGRRFMAAPSHGNEPFVSSVVLVEILGHRPSYPCYGSDDCEARGGRFAPGASLQELHHTTGLNLSRQRGRTQSGTPHLIGAGGETGGDGPQEPAAVDEAKDPGRQAPGVGIAACEPRDERPAGDRPDRGDGGGGKPACSQQRPARQRAPPRHQEQRQLGRRIGACNGALLAWLGHPVGTMSGSHAVGAWSERLHVGGRLPRARRDIP